MIEDADSNGATARSAMAKAMLRIVPFAMLAYLIAYMDRVNVSFASLQMNADLKFSATIYGLGGGLFYLGYALFEVPSGAMASRYGARPWLARVMITWGVLAAGMMFVRTPMQFYVMRFLLGIAEAGLFPCLLLYFSAWFPAAWRGRAVSRMYVASPLGTALMGAVSASLLDLDGVGGLQGWQWLFLVQGAPAVLLGIAILRFLPDTPGSAAWLNNSEKIWFGDAMARDAASIGEPAQYGLFQALTHPMVFRIGMIGFVLNAATVGFVLSTPAVLISRAGLDTAQVGRLIALGGLLGAVTMLSAGWHSDRRNDRLRYSILGAAIIALSLPVIAFGPTSATVVLGYLAFSIAVFTTGCMMMSACADVLHPRQLAVGVGAINMMWQFGSFVSPYGWGILKDRTGDFGAGLVAGSLLATILAVLVAHVRTRVIARQSQGVA